MKAAKLAIAVSVGAVWLAWACTGSAWGYSRSLLEATYGNSDTMNDLLLVAEAEPAQAPGSALQDELALKKSLRSPGVAMGLAIAPGILLHGSGHFYAERPWTAAALLLAEAGGLYMAYRGGSEAYSVLDSVDLNKFTNYHGESGQLSQGVGLAVGGAMIFLASWLYDITGSPIAVEQANAEKKSKAAHGASPVVTPRLTPQGFEVVIERLF